VLYLNLDAPDDALRIVQELIAQKDGGVPFLGLAPTRPRVLENPVIVAALQEAGVPVY
jgi:hypothetical protein